MTQDTPEKKKRPYRRTSLLNNKTSNFVKHLIRSHHRNNKYNAKACYVDDKRFASQKEARYYGALKVRKLMGEIQDFECQVSFPLVAGIHYRGDFLITEKDESLTCVDVKGFKTPVYKLKKKLFCHVYPHIKFVEV